MSKIKEKCILRNLNEAINRRAGRIALHWIAFVYKIIFISFLNILRKNKKKSFVKLMYKIDNSTRIFAIEVPSYLVLKMVSLNLKV